MTAFSLTCRASNAAAFRIESWESLAIASMACGVTAGFNRTAVRKACARTRGISRGSIADLTSAGATEGSLIIFIVSMALYRSRGSGIVRALTRMGVTGAPRCTNWPMAQNSWLPDSNGSKASARLTSSGLSGSVFGGTVVFGPASGSGGRLYGICTEWRNGCSCSAACPIPDTRRLMAMAQPRPCRITIEEPLEPLRPDPVPCMTVPLLRPSGTLPFTPASRSPLYRVLAARWNIPAGPPWLTAL